MTFALVHFLGGEKPSVVADTQRHRPAIQLVQEKETAAVPQPAVAQAVSQPSSEPAPQTPNMQTVPAPVPAASAPVPAAVVNSAPDVAAAPEPPLPPNIAPETTRKVKRATAYLKVVSADGSTGEGSGFFAVQPGILVTNASVVGMLDAGTRKPKSVQVVVNSGEKGEVRLNGTVLGVDRQSDLALVRISGDAQSWPARLPVQVDMTGLIELQPVYIFGFPLGASLGKEISVSDARITSFRKNSDGSLRQIQLNGSMNTGQLGRADRR